MNPVLKRLRHRVTRYQLLFKEYRRGRSASSSRGALSALDSTLKPVHFGGQELVGRMIPGLGGHDVAARNLLLVADVMDMLGLPYFLVPGESRVRYTVGVNERDRARILGALREHHSGKAVFAAFPSGTSKMNNPALLSDPFFPPGLTDASVIRIGELVLGPSGQILYGPEVACDIEFWCEGSEILDIKEGRSKVSRIRSQDSEEVLRRSIIAPQPNRIVDVLPSAEQKPSWVNVGQRILPTFEVFTSATADDVSGPIDVVYTWVDGNDAKIREKRKQFLSGWESDISKREYSESRYTSYDELKYSLRSLWMYAPFVRNIYIVTDDQIPDWLDTSQDRVHVVSHREIFPEGALPVFNSHAIEARLHHIPGLSEHYLYLNDDVFIGRPVTPQHFFFGDRITRVPISPFKVGVGEPYADEPAPNSAGKNVRELLQEDYGRFTVNKFKHVPHPFRRSAVFSAEDAYSEAFSDTTKSRFRSIGDVQMASLVHHNEMFSGGAVPADFRMIYVDIANSKARRLLERLRSRRSWDFFCVNDVDSPVEKVEEHHQMITDFLQEYFPFPSPWEIGASEGVAEPPVVSENQP